MIKNITPPFCDQSSPHGFKNSQIAENGTRINLKLARQFSCGPSLWALNQFTLDLLNPLQAAFRCSDRRSPFTIRDTVTYKPCKIGGFWEETRGNEGKILQLDLTK